MKRGRRCGTRIGATVAGLMILAFAPLCVDAGGAQVLPGTALGSTVPHYPDTIVEASNPLEETALHFAQAWAAGGGNQTGSLLAPDGIRLQLGGGSHSGLSVRQATASFREFLRDFEEGEAVLLRASHVAGSVDRGSAVIGWSARVSGTSQRVERTLFLGLAREEGDSWRIDEVRLLR